MVGVRLCGRPVRFTTRPDALCDGGRIVSRRNWDRSKEREAREGEERGGMGSRPILLIVAVALVLGIAVYLRLWTIDFSISSDDAELVRRQFDLANREAMDESAEWRRMFDEQQERASKCEVELREAKESTHNDGEGTADCSSKLVQLQKVNSALLRQIEALKHELEVERLKCKS